MNRNQKQISKDINLILEAATIATSYKDITDLTGLSYAQIKKSMEKHYKYKARIVRMLEANKELEKVQKAQTSKNAQTKAQAIAQATQNAQTKAQAIAQVTQNAQANTQAIQNAQTMIPANTQAIAQRPVQVASANENSNTTNWTTVETSTFNKIHNGTIYRFYNASFSMMLRRGNSYIERGPVNVENGDELFFVSHRENVLFFTHMKVVDVDTSKVVVVRKLKFYDDSGRTLCNYPQKILDFYSKEAKRLRNREYVANPWAKII